MKDKKNIKNFIEKGDKFMFTVNLTLDHDECQGSECEACAYVCPTNVFVIKENKICVYSPQYCKLCYECLEICPTTALNLKKLEWDTL